MRKLVHGDEFHSPLAVYMACTCIAGCSTEFRAYYTTVVYSEAEGTHTIG
jgi:hypothetical protein